MAALAQPVPQQAEIESVVKQITLPEGVRLRRVILDTDHSGDASVYVILGVSRKLDATPAMVKRLGVLRGAVTEAIDQLGFDLLPYVRFEDMR